MITNLVTISPNTSIYEAAKKMRDSKIGSIVVTKNSQVVGIVTERDLVRRVLAEYLDPRTITINNIMTPQVTSISPEEDIADAAHLMRKNGIRRLTVLQDGTLVGIITTNDLLRNMTRHIEDVASMLYLIGRTWM
jgi:CBS domain-containing protein